MIRRCNICLSELIGVSWADDLAHRIQESLQTTKIVGEDAKLSCRLYTEWVKPGEWYNAKV